jgi:hypothetical protein
MKHNEYYMEQVEGAVWRFVMMLAMESYRFSSAVSLTLCDFRVDMSRGRPTQGSECCQNSTSYISRSGGSRVRRMESHTDCVKVDGATCGVKSL